jgi:dual specificity phosphatase 12
MWRISKHTRSSVYCLQCGAGSQSTKSVRCFRSHVPVNLIFHLLQTFIQHQILLDDTEDADVLRHLLPSIHFIQAELDKGRGVLVHCHGGISEPGTFLEFLLGQFDIIETGRSATIVASYLMYTRNIDTEAALEMIRKVRPNIECV